MQRLCFIIIALFCTIKASASWAYSVNYDEKTIAAMVAAYTTGAITEDSYNEQIQKILKHYTNAEVATAGIYLSKYLERKAMTNLGIWSSSTENYYYRRIYDMVANKIMPKIYTVAGLMLKTPQNAVYWGSYLIKICGEVQNLCCQFESVVTNSTLTFSDIQFLAINSEIANLLNLTKIGSVDFQQLLDDLSSIPQNLTKDNLISDITNLYQNGVGLANAGMGSITNSLLQSSNFNDLFNGKVEAVFDIVDNYSDLFESLDNSVGNTLLSMLGGTADVSNLFEVSDYNLTSWMTDYVSEIEDQYYTQRWYIYSSDTGSEIICSYVPPTDEDAIESGDHWYRIATYNTDYTPSTAEKEAILQNSESHAGYSRSWVEQMNASNDGNTYKIAYALNEQTIKSDFVLSHLLKKAYAYSIYVTKSWSNKEEVYEDVFDSYSMDLTTFKNLLQVKLNELNNNEEGITYYLGSDSKKYYQATSAAKLEGVESVTISVTCENGTEIASGATTYKCGTCGSSVNSHTKECSMATTVEESDLDLTELTSQLTEAQAKVTSITATIAEYEEWNEELIELIANSSINDATKYREQYNDNLSLISDHKKNLASWQTKVEQLEAALAEAEADEADDTDQHYRIPAIMAECKSAFGLSWDDSGSWNGYTFTRTATMPNIDGTITFEATISMARKPKYVMGIKIHRAVIKIEWSLTSDYSSTEVVETMTLDQSKSDEEKADEVNAKISEVAQSYPECDVSVEYEKSEGAEDDASDDVQHLLWSSDRLEIARDIESRLTKIFSQLVIIEKFLHYKHNIVDMLLSYGPTVNTDQGRHREIADSAFIRWRDAGQQALTLNNDDDENSD